MKRETCWRNVRSVCGKYLFTMSYCRATVYYGRSLFLQRYSRLIGFFFARACVSAARDSLSAGSSELNNRMRHAMLPMPSLPHFQFQSSLNDASLRVHTCPRVRGVRVAKYTGVAIENIVTTLHNNTFLAKRMSQYEILLYLKLS